MNWMSVIKKYSNILAKRNETSIAVISSDMNPPNYSLSHMSSTSMYTKLIQPLFKPPTSQKTIEKLLNNYKVNWRQSYLIPQKITIIHPSEFFSTKF